MSRASACSDSVLGVGGMIGGVRRCLLLGRRGAWPTDFGVGVLLWAAPLLLIVVAPTPGRRRLAGDLPHRAGQLLVDINAYTIIQRVAPAEVMGRVFGALESVLTGGMAIGALLMPVLIDTVGLRTGLAVGGAVAVLAIAGLPVLRRLDTTVLAPPGLALLRGVPMLAILPPPVLERLAHVLVPVEVRRNGVVVPARATPATGSGDHRAGEAQVSIGSATSARSGQATRSARSRCCATCRARRQ